MGIVKFIKKVWDATKLKAPAGTKIIGDAVPFTPVGAGIGIIGGAKKIVGGLSGVAKVAYTKLRPDVFGKGIATGLKYVGKKTLGGGLLGGLAGLGYGVAKGGITGETPNARKILQSSLVGAGIGISPLGGGLGAAAGLITEGAKKAGDIVLPKPDITTPTNPYADFKYPDFNFPEIPQATTVIYPPQLAPPSVGSSFSPSVSLGGGGIGENLPLLLLLAGGLGVGGYAIAKRRKRKKKKKYKKRKKR